MFILVNICIFYSVCRHSLLFDYGVTEDDGYSTNDPDWNLVPQLVEKVAIPILHHDIVHCWDILSTHATRNAVSAINMIINYFPDTASISGLQNLFGAIRSRLSDAVDNLTVCNLIIFISVLPLVCFDLLELVGLMYYFKTLNDIIRGLLSILL